MTFVLTTQFHFYLPCLYVHLAKCLNSVLNVKVSVGAFYKGKALIGAFNVILKSSRTFVSSSRL